MTPALGHRLWQSVIVACLVLGVAGWIAKLFTVKITYQDDPSTGLVWRTQPSCTHEMRVTGADPHRVYLVREDDNAFAGEWLYDWFVDWATFLGPIGALGVLLYSRRSRRRGPRRSPLGPS